MQFSLVISQRKNGDFSSRRPNMKATGIAVIFILGLACLVGYGFYKNSVAPGYSLPGEAAPNSPNEALDQSMPESSPTPQLPMPSLATIYISSTTFSAGVGETFTLSVMATAQNAVGWEFHLFFNPNILHATTVIQGNFLRSSGMSTYFIDSGGYNDCCGIHNEAGYVWLVEAILGKSVGASGTGCLAQITFQVVSSGSSPLTLQDAKMCAPGPQLMPVTVVSATFHS
jgi:hypothetical protein